MKTRKKVFHSWYFYIFLAISVHLNFGCIARDYFRVYWSDLHITLLLSLAKITLPFRNVFFLVLYDYLAATNKLNDKNFMVNDLVNHQIELLGKKK